MGFSLGVSDSLLDIMHTRLTATAHLYFVGLNPQAVAKAEDCILGIKGVAFVNDFIKILLLLLAPQIVTTAKRTITITTTV